jgi:23S rRNA (adenine2030-N6)-methyltransferase
VSPLSDPSKLNGCGLVIVNPPWTLESDLRAILPALATVLGRNGKGSFHLDWLAGERVVPAR